MFASGCFKMSCCVLFTVHWDNVDFGRICRGRERDTCSEKTAHVGTITKIVDCIRIVSGLPFNYKRWYKSHSSQALQWAQCLLRDSFRDTNRESCCRTRHIHLRLVPTNCKQDDLKQSAVKQGIVLLFGLSFRDTQQAGEYLSWTSVWTRVYPGVSSRQRELV